MTKADLIDEVSKISSLTKKETETIVNTIFDNITDALSKGSGASGSVTGTRERAAIPRRDRAWTSRRSGCPSSR